MADTETSNGADNTTAEKGADNTTAEKGADNTTAEKPADNTIAEKPTELETKIIRQVEYYFGDANLGRDKFLREQIKQNDGWVKLDVLITFNRLKSLSTDFDVICNALKKSTAELLEVDSDDKKVRRSPSKPLPVNTADRREDINSRSVYAKGFPLDTTLDQVQEFMQKHGEVESIGLRKDQHKKFKGSIFALFKTKESADEFIKAESIKYEDTELKRLLKDTYFKQKIEERAANKEKYQKEKQEKKAKREEEEMSELKEKMTKGALLQLTDLPDELSREDIKAVFTDHAEIAWIDFERGEEKAVIRFSEEDQAAMAWEKAKEAGEGKVVIKEKEVTCTVLEGEDELNQWKEALKQQAERRKKNKGKSHRGRGHQHHKRGRGGGDEPPRKQAKRE